MKTNRKGAQVGCDCHRLFSRITARDQDGRIIWRQRLEHGNRARLRKQLSDWPAGTPVIMEGTFGWGWLSDEMLAAGLDPHLASSTKLAAWRTARGLAKSDRIDADLLSELWSQQPRWWEVWLAPRANDSGLDPEDQDAPKGRHVGRMGRRTLKWAWIEAAHGAVRKDGRFRAIFDRYTDGGKRNRNRGYIVVAHELCRIAYMLLNKEIDYDASALPARPGSKRKKPTKKKAMKVLSSLASRPGTGQPLRPMVAAV